MDRNDFGIQRIPRQDPTKVFDGWARYNTLLATVNAKLIETRGVRLIPTAFDMPLGEDWESKMPAPIKGVMDWEIPAGDMAELNEIAIRLGIDLSTF